MSNILNYEFQPGDAVFVVIDDTRMEAGTVLNVQFKIYDIEAVSTEIITYTVALDDFEEGVVSSDSTVVFGTLQDAAAYVAMRVTPNVTVTPSVTPVYMNLFGAEFGEEFN